MGKIDNYEMSNPGKALIVIPIILWVLFVVGTLIIFIAQTVLIGGYVDIAVILKVLAVYSGLALLLFGTGSLFGVLIYKKNKIGLYGYSLYILLKLYITYNTVIDTGKGIIGGIGVVLYIFEIVIVLKLWFSKNGKLWFKKNEEIEN